MVLLKPLSLPKVILLIEHQIMDRTLHNHSNVKGKQNAKNFCVHFKIKRLCSIAELAPLPSCSQDFDLILDNQILTTSHLILTTANSQEATLDETEGTHAENLTLHDHSRLKQLAQLGFYQEKPFSVDAQQPIFNLYYHPFENKRLKVI